jgi:hypothetical protein
MTRGSAQVRWVVPRGRERFAHVGLAAHDYHGRSRNHHTSVRVHDAPGPSCGVRRFYNQLSDWPSGVRATGRQHRCMPTHVRLPE